MHYSKAGHLEAMYAVEADFDMMKAIVWIFNGQMYFVVGERYARTKENNLPLSDEFMKQVKKRKNVIAAIKLDGQNPG